MRYPDIWNQTSAYISPKQESAKIFFKKKKKEREGKREEIEISATLCFLPPSMFRIVIFPTIPQSPRISKGKR